MEEGAMMRLVPPAWGGGGVVCSGGARRILLAYRHRACTVTVDPHTINQMEPGRWDRASYYSTTSTADL
eukprot:1131001-Prorocentrum_minimum.AAC.1